MLISSFHTALMTPGIQNNKGIFDGGLGQYFIPATQKIVNGMGWFASSIASKM